jgi:hypothetical protein
MSFYNDTASKRLKPLSMEDYVRFLVCDGSVHHANTAHRVCSVRRTAFSSGSIPLLTSKAKLSESLTSTFTVTSKGKLFQPISSAPTL